MTSTGTSRSVLVVAGEASADAHGAKVLRRLKGLCPGVRCFGLGGERLLGAGLEPVADADRLGVVGLSEVVRNLRGIHRLFGRMRRAAEMRHPAAALLLDLPDFNLRLAARLKRMNVPVIYYIAPQAWAWRRGRVRQLRRRVSRLCVVFPFEEPFFSRHGVPVEFVGHPLTEEESSSDGAGVDRIALVPGSRPREVERLLPAIAAAAGIIQRERGSVEFVLPLAPGIDEDRVRDELSRAGVEAKLIRGGAAQAFKQVRVAIVASGTATLEATLCGVPMVVVYRLSKTTYALVRMVYRLEHACIVNILAGREVVPELLQGRVRPETIARHALELLPDGPRRFQTVEDLRQVAASLGRRSPSRRVAEIVAEHLPDLQE